MTSRGRLPIAELKSQLGRAPLEPLVPGVPRGLIFQAVRFAMIGVISTIAYVLLFLGFHAELGAQIANLVALLLTALANTAANRRFTFGVRGPERAGVHQAQGLIVFGLGLAITGGSRAVLHSAAPAASRTLELSVLVTADLAATVLRFLLLRRWVFRRAPT